MLFIPEFVTTAEADAIHRAVYEEVDGLRWTQLRYRRLINLGGTPLLEGMCPEPIPDAFHAVMARAFDAKMLPYACNHILINEYRPGHGILPHEDGPLYHPSVVIVSLLSSAILRFRKKSSSSFTSRYPDVFGVYLTPRSVICFHEELYTDYLHSIEDKTEDIMTEDIINLDSFGNALRLGQAVPRDVRLSLTLRVVKKVRSVMEGSAAEEGEEIRRLWEQKMRGILTEEEFRQAKELLLAASLST